MKRASSLILLGIVISLLSTPKAESKGDGVGLWIEGRVSNLQIDGDRLRFRLTGKFVFDQYRDSARSVVEVDGRRGIPITIRQADPFFAMTSDWHGGAIQERGALRRILESAAKAGNVVKFELTEGQLKFERGGAFSVTDGAVVRATDANLR